MIADAPWIRDAEMYGDGPCLEPECPVCGSRCETIYEIGGSVVGCEHCVDEYDAYEWLAQKIEDGRE